MSGQKSKSTVPKSTVSAATSRTTTSDATQPRRRMVQNYLVIWVDGNIDENTEDCRNTLAQLRAAVIEVNVCTTPEGCIEFLNEMDDGKAFIISSGALGQHLVADIHSMPKVDAIYIFCGNKARHESWAKDWPKIRGVFTSIKPICESLKKDEETADAYSKLKNEDWKCKCSVRNKASRDKCMSCQQPRPSPSSDSYAAAAEVIEEKRGKRPSSSAKYQDYHDSDDHESAKNNQMLHKQQKIQSGGLHFETLVTDIPLKFNNLN
ncbi:unnamed protein product [Rotaria magnacalcarata]|uniref:RanBP2-type domain-containing protein n=1 Tax=Rotaria magnacalcarata TaxID=392030 RepID=A0A816TKZ1_9BILA|nr:unnamed protein product [Rotaria magnacalcarata]